MESAFGAPLRMASVSIDCRFDLSKRTFSAEVASALALD